MKSKIRFNSLKDKIWLYLIAFSAIILIFLWLFQIIFLNLFYEKAKIKELKNTVLEIKKAYDVNTLYNKVDLLARDSGICIQIIVGNDLIYDASSFNKGCVPEIKNNNYKNMFYDSNKREETYKLINPRYDNEVLIKAIKLNDNTYVFASTSLEPLDNAISILKDQFIFVTIIVLLMSLIIALFISKKISKPIEKINRSALKMATGDYNNTFYIEEDIKELKELVNTLNYTNNELTKANNLRRELLANVSHDLKTPLTMIKAYAEMIRDLTYKDSKKRNENLNTIIEESDRLNLLVNDILDLSVLQSQTFKLDIKEFDLKELIINILNRYKIYEDEYKFIFNYDKELFVLADQKRIEQVIYNLLNNAINYAGSDKIIKIDINAKDANYAKVMIMDNGLGISKDDIKLIWDKYYKADKTHSRNKVGTGIGLSIVKNILINHKFKYGVDSKLNKGTTFWFEIKRKN